MRTLSILSFYPPAVYAAVTFLFSTGVVQAQQRAAAADKGSQAVVPSSPTPKVATAPAQAPKTAQAAGAARVQTAGGLNTPARPRDAESEQGAFDFDTALSQGAVAMTAEQAAKLAVESGPSIASANAAQRKAEVGAAGAWIAVYPKLELTARYTRLSKVEIGQLIPDQTPEQKKKIAQDATADPANAAFNADMLQALQGFSQINFPQILNQYALRAAVTYPVSDVFFAIMPGYKSAKGFSEAAAWSVKVEQQKLVQQAREAYYNYARARASLFVARAALAQVEAHRKDIVAMVDAGTLAKVELMRIDAQVAAARVAIARAEGGMAIAKTGLGVLTGKKIAEDVAITEQLSHPLPELTESQEQLVAQASERRPEVLALRALSSAYQLSADSNGGGRLPHLALSAGVDYANPNSRAFPQEEKFKPSWDISAILTWSPNSYFDANSKVSGAEADLAKVRADLESLEQGLTIEVAQAYEQYNSARAAMEAAESGIAAAEESFRVRREQFRAGAAVATEVLDAEAGLRNARLELVNAAIDMRIARVRLDHAIGKEL
jgi:outer membrane protein TolC